MLLPGSNAEELCVNKVVHKAYIDVNEEGCEAAAATGVRIMAACIPIERKKKKFVADKPFLFYILDKRTHSVLFLGRFVEPLDCSSWRSHVNFVCSIKIIAFHANFQILYIFFFFIKFFVWIVFFTLKLSPIKNLFKINSSFEALSIYDYIYWKV